MATSAPGDYVGRGLGAKDEGFPTETRKVIAAALFAFGSGAAFSFYLAGVGFFVVQFKSRGILPWMLLISYCTFPVALLAQGKFDAFFDKLFTPRITFFFRVLVIPVFMAAIIGAIAFLCTLWVPLLSCGFVLGFMYAASLASSIQMTSTWEPLLVVWTQIGNTLGAATPIAAFFIFSFTASTATKIHFQLILLVPISICIMTSSILMYWHFKLDLFEHVYRRLSYDLPEDDSPPDLMLLKRGTSADAPVYEKDDVDCHGVPLWVPWYTFLAGLNTFMSFALLPFATYFGDADLAQTLVLAKLAMDCMGRFSALFWGYFYGDLAEPIHAQVIIQLICRLVVGVVLALSLLHFLSLHRALFLTLWCLFFWDGCYLASQIDVVTTRCSVVGQRKAVSRKNVLCTYAGLLIGLILAVAVVQLTGMM